MNKLVLVEEVANKLHKTPHEVQSVLDTAIEVITDTLIRGFGVQIYGFGTFDIRTRAERIGCNPRTGETIRLPEAKHVHFKQSKTLRKLLNPGDADG